ncbi:MAG: hypothetical protein U0570_06920 [Phycisphaerales bacterium]
MSHPKHPTHHAVTLIECAGASIILGLMLVAGLRAAAGAGASQAASARALSGTLLAESLLNEVLAKSYEEAPGTASLGLDAGELATDKTTFDDVDDYNGWTESPPKAFDGSALPSMTNWSRSVAVLRVSTSSPDSSSASETGLKRIEVTVKYGGKVVCKLTGLRASDS